MKTLLPVEKPLLQKKINLCVNSLQAGTDTLKWNSESNKVDKFIRTAKDAVMEVDELTKKLKENVQKMHEVMEKWKDPFFERQGSKPVKPDVFISTHAATVENRYEQVTAQGKEIHRYLKDTFDSTKSDKKSA